MITRWAELNPTQLVALKGYGGEPGVYVRASMLKALKGDGSAAVYLTQMLYWSQSDKARDNGGWFYLTTNKVSDDLGMSAKVQRRVREMLTELGVLETKLEGVPARNYYRVHLDQVIDLVATQFYDVEVRDGEWAEQDVPDGEIQLCPKGATGSAQREQQAVPKVPNIVNKPVRVMSKPSVPAAKPVRSPAKDKPKTIYVFPDLYEAHVDGIVTNYPRDYAGNVVTRGLAMHALNKVGNVPVNAGEDEIAAAKIRLSQLIAGIKNLKRAVERGEVEHRYVPGFRKFSGIGAAFGEEPPYVQWSERQVAERKEVLVH